MNAEGLKEYADDEIRKRTDNAEYGRRCGWLFTGIKSHTWIVTHN